MSYKGEMIIVALAVIVAVGMYIYLGSIIGKNEELVTERTETIQALNDTCIDTTCHAYFIKGVNDISDTTVSFTVDDYDVNNQLPSTFFTKENQTIHIQRTNLNKNPNDYLQQYVYLYVDDTNQLQINMVNP